MLLNSRASVSFIGTLIYCKTKDMQASQVSNVFSFSYQYKPAYISCPQPHFSLSQKRPHDAAVAQVFMLGSWGMRGQASPMVCQKAAVTSGAVKLWPYSRGVVPGRDLCISASAVQSSVLRPGDDCQIAGAEEIPPESDRKGSADTEHLPDGLCPSLMPKHVAIIMDGNSRWAERRGLPASAGHEAGRRALAEIVKLSCKWGIRILTVFAFSTDNWYRPKMEVDLLMRLFESVIERELENLKRDNIQVHMIGDSSRLPNSLQRLIAEAVEATEKNSGLKFVIAVSYSGRQDIVQASRKLAERVEAGQLKAADITESLFEEELETSCAEGFGNPDLVIRTSGELRLSNFLLWQLAYSELYFDDSFWPEFGEAEYVKAMQSFQYRHRRFGKRFCSNAEDAI